MNKKILVSAYGCEPFRGSEAGVGWNWVVQMAKKNELYVITRLNDKEKIEKNIPEEIKSNLHFYYYDTCKLLQKIKKKEKRLYIYYFFWQIGIIKIIKKLVKEIDFDYSMHLTFGSFWMPTFLPFFHIPFIWGPIGGGDGVPKAYIKNFPLKQRIIQRMRYVLIDTSFMNPLVTVPSKRAVAILCRTENNVMAIPKKYRNKTHVILETAMEPEVFHYSKDYSRINDAVEIIVTGRMVPFKNVIAAVDVMKELKKKYEKIHMTIIGKGPEREKVQNRIREYHLEESITLIKELPREEVLHYLEKSDIYFFPSLREGGSWALMEGMAIGLPVVCLDWTGMSVITDEESAIRMKPSNYEKTVSDLAEATERLIQSEAFRRNMGKMGRKRIAEMYNWEVKGKFMEELLSTLEE